MNKLNNFYLAGPLFNDVQNKSGLIKKGENQLIIFKTFWHDLKSAKQTIKFGNFYEKQIFRIDHYLEMIQNIMMVRL